jgi:hypothetical protein
MFDWLGDAWDGFTGLFGGEDASANIGPLADGGSYGDLLDDGLDNNTISSWNDTVNPIPKPKPESAPWYTNPNVLGSAITAGAGLFGNMSALDAKRENDRANREAQKMNSLLELAKLKHSILNKSSSGGTRSGGSGAKAEDTARQHSVNKINQYNNLGSSLSSIYKG